MDHHSNDRHLSFLHLTDFFYQKCRINWPGKAGFFVKLVPIFSSILAVNYLGVTFESYHSVALLLVFAGIFLFERFKAV